MLEPLLILLLWALMIAIIRVDIEGTDLDSDPIQNIDLNENYWRPAMAVNHSPFLVNRQQLPRYLASLGELPEGTVIYKLFSFIDEPGTTWYVDTEDPDIDRGDDLADQYGGAWYRYDDLFRITEDDLEQSDEWANREVPH